MFFVMTLLMRFAALTMFSMLLVMLCAALSAMLLVGLAMALATHAVLLTMGLSAATSRFRSGSLNGYNCRIHRPFYSILS